MPVGKMDILINIESATETRSAVTGQMIQSWITHVSVWAEEVPKGSSENAKGEQITSLNEKVFRVRYQSDITQKMRIYDPELARYYDIVGISMEGRKRYLLLTTKSHQVNPVG